MSYIDVPTLLSAFNTRAEALDESIAEIVSGLTAVAVDADSLPESSLLGEDEDLAMSAPVMGLTGAPDILDADEGEELTEETEETPEETAEETTEEGSEDQSDQEEEKEDTVEETVEETVDETVEEPSEETEEEVVSEE